MTAPLLGRLRSRHAFDSSPLRIDMAADHVPTLQLGAERNLEDRLLQAAINTERVVIVGLSGSGKTSLIEFVFAGDVENVAPIAVRLSPEAPEVVTSTQHVAEHIMATLVDAAQAGATQPPATTERTTSFSLSATWMGVRLGTEISNQNTESRTVRTTAATLESLEQMLRSIGNAGYVPVLIFDDTDRWFSRDDLGPAGKFFETVLPELRDLPCALVVTAHNAYIEDPDVGRHMKASRETRITLPPLASIEALRAVIDSRISAHSDQPANCDDVLTSPPRSRRAVDSLRHEHGGESSRCHANPPRRTHRSVRRRPGTDHRRTHRHLRNLVAEPRTNKHLTSHGSVCV